MAFNKSFTTSSAGQIKLKHASACQRLSIQQGDCMAQLTLYSLTQTQFEPLFYLPVRFPRCNWETDYQQLRSPEHSWEIPGAPLVIFPCHSMANKSVVPSTQQGTSLLDIKYTQKIFPLQKSARSHGVLHQASSMKRRQHSPSFTSGWI